MTAEKFGEKYLGWIIVIVILVLAHRYFFGVTIPGAFYERDANYTTKIYVLLSPQDSQSKNYRVPADVEKNDSGYSLTKVYWPDGGTSEFSDCSVNPPPRGDFCNPDGSDTGYKILLTKDVVKPRQVF